MFILERKTRRALHYKLAQKRIFLYSDSFVTSVISVTFVYVQNALKEVTVLSFNHFENALKMSPHKGNGPGKNPP